LGANADPGEYQMSEYHEGERGQIKNFSSRPP